VLRLPAALVIARESAAAGGDFIGFTSSNTMRCPLCGFDIPIAELTKPKPPPSKLLSYGFTAVVIAAIAFGLYQCSGG
jgi:hypothetical protein